MNCFIKLLHFGKLFQRCMLDSRSTSKSFMVNVKIIHFQRQTRVSKYSRVFACRRRTIIVTDYMERIFFPREIILTVYVWITLNVKLNHVQRQLYSCSTSNVCVRFQVQLFSEVDINVALMWKIIDAVHRIPCPLLQNSYDQNHQYCYDDVHSQ